MNRSTTHMYDNLRKGVLRLLYVYLFLFRPPLYLKQN